MKLNKTFLVVGICTLLGLFLVLPSNLLAGRGALEGTVHEGYQILAEADDVDSGESMEQEEGVNEEQDQGTDEESQENPLGSDEDEESGDESFPRGYERDDTGMARPEDVAGETEE
jgi:hypothetical protein